MSSPKIHFLEHLSILKKLACQTQEARLIKNSSAFSLVTVLFNESECTYTPGN